MITYQKAGITAATVLDTRRKLTNNLYRVRVRVTFNRKTREYSTGKAFSLDEWNALSDNKWKPLSANEWKIFSSNSVTDLKETLSDIHSTFDIIKNHIKNLTENESFSFEALNNALMRNNDNQTVNAFFKEKINDLKENEREGSRLYYDNILKGIERYKGTNILFESVTPEWLKRYERFLIAEKKTYTTVGMHMRAIRAILNIAKQKSIIKEVNYPFGRNRYEIPTGESRKMALTIDQVGKLVNFNDGNPATEKYRDLWFFSYLCNGINFADLCRLKYSDISNGEIRWLREKTKNTSKQKKYIQAYLTTEMANIIKKWGNIPMPENYIFPFLIPGLDPIRQKQITSDIIGRVNHKMKYIGEQTGIGRISTYTARHSYATVLKRAGSNIAFISESLGHSDLKTTQDYLASFETVERVKNAAFLTNFNTTEEE